MSNKIWDDKSTDLTLSSSISISSDTSANISLVAPNGQTGSGATDQTSVTFSVTGVSTFPDGTSAMVDYLTSGMKLVTEQSEYQQDLQVQEQAL